jgi:hypothetical protein
MLKTFQVNKLGFHWLLLVSLLLGVFIGTGAAYADIAGEWQVEGGWYLYPDKTHNNFQFFFTNHGYDQDHYALANQDYPSATEFEIDDIGYWNGWSDDHYYVEFHMFEMDTLDGSNYYQDFDWAGDLVDGHHTFLDNLGWEYDDFNGSDYNVNIRQIVTEGAWFDPDDSTDHITDFEVY